MRKTLISIAVAALVTAPFAVVADSANWSEEKAAQVDQNRNTNSGNGNGGERQFRDFHMQLQGLLFGTRGSPTRETRDRAD